MPRPNKRQLHGRRMAMLMKMSKAKKTKSTDTLLNHPSDLAQTQQYHENASETQNIGLVPQPAEECSFTNGSISNKEIEKPNKCFVKLKNIPKYRSAYPRKKVNPRQSNKIEETRREQDVLLNQCVALQNREGSSTSDIDGRLNDIMERLNENCANCASNFEHENERNVKFKTIQHNPIAKSNEIEIIDAIFYIYGLTVADWSKTLTSDHESDFTSASEIVFSNGITFCHNCTSELENVYASHKRLKELAHYKSLFSKSLDNKTSREMQNKIECDNEYEESSLNNSNLSDEEMQFKKEDDSELDPLDEPLMDDGVHDLQFSTNISYTASEKAAENNLVAHNEDNLSLTNMQRKTSRKIKSKISEHHRHPAYSRPRRSTKSKFRTVDTLPNKKRRVKRKKKSLHRPKPILLRIHPFNILCCDELLVSRDAFANHQLKSHSSDIEKPKLVNCNICEIKIPTNNVNMHMMTYSCVWKKYFKCKICDSQFRSASAMNEHLQTHDPKYATLICDICKAPMHSDFELLLHKSKNHTEAENSKEVACIVCKKLFPSWRKLRRHMKRMHEERQEDYDYKYICIKCNKRFSSEHFLSLHREKSIDCCNMKKRRSVCEKCGKSILTSHLYSHMKDHEDIECPNKELFRCPQCGKMLKHSGSLKKHVMREHQVQPKLFFCEKCGKTTKNMTNMRIHMKVHEKD